MRGQLKSRYGLKPEPVGQFIELYNHNHDDKGQFSTGDGGLTTAALDAAAAKYGPKGTVTTARKVFGQRLDPQTVYDTAAQLTTAQEAWRSGLSADQRTAIEDYTGTGSDYINSILRMGPPEAASMFVGVRNLDGAVASSPPLTDPVTVFRGAAFNMNASVGDVITDPAFVSTSLNPVRTAGFALGTQSTLMQITVPAGEKAPYIGNLSSSRSEQEVLLNRGTSFQVTKVTNVDAGHQIVEAAVVPKSTTIKASGVYVELFNPNHDDHGRFGFGVGVTPGVAAQGGGVSKANDLQWAMSHWRGSFSGSSNMRAIAEGRQPSPSDATSTGRYLSGVLQQGVAEGPTVPASWRSVPGDAPKIGDVLHIPLAATTNSRSEAEGFKDTVLGTTGHLLRVPETNGLAYPAVGHQAAEYIVGGDFKVVSVSSDSRPVVELQKVGSR